MKEKLSHNYKTSKDYNRLFELMKQHRIVCFVDYNREPTENGYMIQDICQSSIILESDSAKIGCRGVSYIDAFEYKENSVLEDFIEQCNDYNLEFIDLNVDTQKD